MKKLVIFDFDGALVNTMPFWFGLHKDVNPDFTWKEYQKMSNGNFWNELDQAVTDGHIFPNGYQEKYNKEIENHTTSLRPVIIELSKKYQLAVVSSGSEPTIKKFLNKEGVGDLFFDVLGFETHKSKTEKLLLLIKKINLKAEDLIFITDTLGDILEANKASVKSIGVTWGLHDKETLQKGNPNAIIDDPNDLLKIIKEVLK